jgi:xanthine dehydrogenase YagR molybdenum-binding subunit
MRLEGWDKVSGRARYASDVRLPGQLYAAVLRSPHPHARVRRVDLSKALQLPGVHAALSSFDAPEISWYETSRLFDRTVRLVGDEVAAVAAENEEIARDALRLVGVEYEPLAFDAKRGAPEKPQVEGRGDLASGMAAADLVLEETYTTATALHNALESHGCTAAWEGERLTLYESTQGIFDVRDELAGKLGLAPERVRVITEHMGGGFGAKQVAWKHSVIAALLARRAGRPVQLLLDRSAENLAVGNRNATLQRVRLGAKRDGTLTAIDVHVDIDGGAYSVGGEDSDVSGTYLTLYRCANVRAEQVVRRTNLGPAVAFRAPGHAEGNFALESAMDELAHRLELDPIALRLANYAQDDQRKGKPYTSAQSLRRCIELVGREFRAAKRQSGKRQAGNDRRRGIGFAAHDWMAGAGHPPAEVRVELHDAKATLIVGVQDIGTGTRTGLARLLSRELNLPMEKIIVQLGDTGRGVRGPASSGSSTLPSLAPALIEAARQAKAGGRGEARRAKNRADMSIRTCGAQCAQVEVDTDTGEVRVLRVVAAHDCGRVVEPKLVESQVIGGITQGIGYAILEERLLDARLGEVLNANLEEYKVPTLADLPEIVNLTESMPDEEANPSGVKGIGEPPIIPTAAAIANAVFEATGVRVRSLPLKREKLLR